MSVEKILFDWKKKKFSPIYWLEGEETWFIDEITDYAEHHLLTEQEASFNLTILYGKDVSWPDVMNACRRYPMFSDLQVVLLKEAQQMRDIEKLTPYFNKPLSSTIFIVAYREKKVDSRTTFGKLVKSKTDYHYFKNISENELPGWAHGYVSSRGLKISDQSVKLLTDHTGNDLHVLTSEIGKIMLNLGKRKEITEDDIEQYVGVSKEFNAFELQKAVAARDLYRAVRIINYFNANPKAGPIQMVVATLYAFFSKVYMLFGVEAGKRDGAAAAIGVSPFFMKDYLTAAQNHGEEGVTRILLLLHHYNLRSVGVGDSGTPDAELMKEMVVKMVADTKK